MSVTLERPVHVWQTRPGWGITVDLTPGEVVASRTVRVNRRLIALALLLVLALCAGLVMLGRASEASAERAYEREQARTSDLAAAANDFAVITSMQTVTAQIEGNLATVMAPDVDIVNLLARIRLALPDGLTITSQAVTLTAPLATAAADPTAETTGGATDATGDTGAPETGTGSQIIGSVTITGTGPAISSVTPFVRRLNRQRGFVDVVPVSTTSTDMGADYTLSLNITDLLYTGPFLQDGAR